MNFARSCAANFERSCRKRRANLERNCCEVRTYFERYVRRLCVAKELHAMRACVYVALEVKLRGGTAELRIETGRIQSILWMYTMARFSEYKRQRIVSLWHDDHIQFTTKPP